MNDMTVDGGIVGAGFAGLAATLTLRRFEGEDGRLSGLRFEDGSLLTACFAFFTIAHITENDLARILGCEPIDGNCVKVNKRMRTIVKRVWSAGDLNGQEHPLAVAAAQAVKAGLDVDTSLPTHRR